MAYNGEPMDIDNIEGDFDNKENSLHHSNVLPRTPCTEKGYEELDVSELNMKLRYSITPASSPMSKSYTAHCLDNRNAEFSDNSIENANLTRSFNSMLTKNDNISKSSKLQPLQIHATGQSLDDNRNASVLRPLDATITDECKNVTVTVTEALDIDENLSLPSSSSSALHTPEATTPTKEIPKNNGGSPIMRGLKSVLNMFRASQSPIPSAENEENIVQHDISSPVEETMASSISSDAAQVALASTPIAARNKREPSSKRGSPRKESIVFNEDLEKELLWKDETTILFSEEKIPIHKLFFQHSKNIVPQVKGLDKVSTTPAADVSLNETVEFMDISYNDSLIKNKTVTEFTDAIQVAESDSEFVDCETTFTNEDEKLSDPDKEHRATFLSDASRATVNMIAQELEISANNKESANSYITEEKPVIVAPDVLEVSDQDIKQNHNAPTEANLTQETESKLCPETPKEPPGGSMPQPLDATAIVDKEDKSVCSSPAVQNIEDKTSTQDTKLLDVTVSIGSNDKPTSVSTFIMNSTQNIAQFASNGINEPQKTTTTIEDKSMPASIVSVNNNTVQLNATQTLEDKPALSSTFDVNATQTIPSYPETINECVNNTVTLTSDVLLSTGVNNITQVIDYNSDQLKIPLDVTASVSPSGQTVQFSSTFILHNSEDSLASEYNKHLDATVTVDSNEKPALSTFIKDSTQNIESHTDKLMKSENKPVSSTFVNDISQDPGIELSYITPTESMQILASSTISKDLTYDIDSEVVVRQNNNILNSSEINNETCKTLEYQERTLSTDKSATLSDEPKCNIQEIFDHQVVSDELESVSNVTLNIGTVMVSIESDTQSHSDISKPTDASLPIAEAIISEYKNTHKEKCELDNTDIPPKELVDYEDKQIVIDQVKPKEISPEYNNINEIKLMNPDILHSSGDCNKIVIDKTEGSVLDLDGSIKVVETLEYKGCGENLAVNIPLPDEDDIKLNPLHSSSNCNKIAIDKTEGSVLDLDGSIKVVETLEYKGCEENLAVNIPLPDEDDIELNPLSTVQLANENNDANSGVLSDVINDLEYSKIQDANQIDGVPINTIDHVKTLSDLTDTLNIEADESNCDYKTIAKNNVVNSHELINSEQVEKITLLENAKTSESKSNDQPESTDISYVNHDSSFHKDSACEVNQDIAINVTIDHDQSYATENKEISGTENHVQSKPTDKIKIVMTSDTIMNTEKISESVEVQHKSENVREIKEMIHEEIIVSESNSPYVLVSVDNKNNGSLEEDFEKIENPLASKTKILLSPPASPPIASKGYNFNFDEIDDPFATKIKIRTSPPFDSPKQINKSVGERVEVPKKDPLHKNKRKSYPVRAKPAITKKNFNSSFDSSLSNQRTKNNNVSVLNEAEEITESFNVLHDNITDTELNMIEKSELEHNIDNASKSINNSKAQNEDKHVEEISTVVSTALEEANLENKSPVASTTHSSSDQSIYLSAATSSGDSVTVKNVFNLPEIDDMNFNPFATKSKICLSPPPSLEMGEPIVTDTKFESQSTTENAYISHAVDTSHNVSQPNKSGHDERDSSDASNVTCSSKDDKDITVREIHTDNEDTIEGPFLDSEDTEVTELGLQNEIKNKEIVGLDLQNDMMEFSDLPVQDNEDNELFIDAAAYEFLLNQNKSNVVMDSGKESLFLKFDPLFAKRLSSEGIAAALSKIQKRQSTPKKIPRLPPVAKTEQAVDGPSTSKLFPQELDTTESIAEDLHITTSKPMMVVTPAVNPIAKPRISTTPASSNRRSITFTSPAIAVIDRLLSLSANNSLVDQNTTITHFDREQDEAELALTQLRELLAEKEINVYNLRSESKELKDRLLTLESQMKVLETEREARLKKVNELNEQLTKKLQINKNMAAVVEEYERTIASLIAETEQDRKRHDDERARLIKERDEQTAHLTSMEVSFSDLHSKYEKSKQIIMTCKANEDTYKKSIIEFEENLTKMQNNYELLKQHATSKLNHANQELEKMNRAHESEVLKLNAMIKRKDLHITSLEETLAQKTKANEELTAICDELINKVG